MRASIIMCIVLTTLYLNLSAQSSNLPLILLTTGGNEIPGDPKLEIHMGIINNTGAVNNINDPLNVYNGIIGIERRGSSSSSWPKKSYSFETRLADGSNQNISLLGLPEENDWILNGPYADKSLMRNVLAFELGRQMGRWAPRTKLCELYIDGNYEGVYVLMEKIKRDGNRLDIAELNPEEISGDDLTGGYVLRIDRPEDYWISAYTSPVGGYSVPISYVYPEYEDMPEEQRDYIKNYVDEFEEALAGSNFMDYYLGYKQYINTESFVDFFLINEMSRNVDAYRLSTYFYKDKESKGGKLTMGPLWDFNFSFGNADYYEAYEAEGWMINSVPAYDSYQAPFWWDRLREDPYFNAALKMRWESLRENVFSKENIDNKIDSLSNLLNEAQGRNFNIYPILGTYIWPNYFIGSTYTSEIDFMKGWIHDRIDWMDSQLGTINEIEQETLTVNSYEVYVFPNPFTENISVRFYALHSCNLQIRIYDIMGKDLLHFQGDYESGFNQKNLQMKEITKQKGIYYLQILVDGELIKSETVIRQ